MSNQGFNQWAAQQPAPAGFNPNATGAAPVPAGPPMGPPVAAPVVAQWGAQPAPQTNPLGVPGLQPAPAQAPLATGNVFGAGAFAGAAPVSERKDCQYGDYVFEIIKTEQYRSREGKPMFRILSRVAHVYSGSQPLGSEVTDTIFFGFPGSDSFKYGMADLLFLSAYAMGCSSDHELKARLQQAFPQCPDPWAAFADAMQDANQASNQFVPPNPLKGRYYRAIVSQGAPDKKKPGQFYTEFNRMLAQAT